VLEVSDETVVHCCAPHPPVRLLRSAGARHLSLDATLLTEVDDDPLGEAVEGGAGLLLGCVPALDAALPPVDDLLAPVRRLWRRLGLAAEALPATVVVTPTCGLAGASGGYARTALETCARAGRALREEAL
jgi:methionine synthase II (cobalamin-independent)